MTGDTTDTHDSLPAPDDRGESDAEAPKPADIAEEEPDTTDENGMPVDNPSGG